MKIGDRFKEPREVGGGMILVEMEVVDIIEQENGIAIKVFREVNGQ